jgi:hypothetical protein
MKERIFIHCTGKFWNYEVKWSDGRHNYQAHGSVEMPETAMVEVLEHMRHRSADDIVETIDEEVERRR